MRLVRLAATGVVAAGLFTCACVRAAPPSPAVPAAPPKLADAARVEKLADKLELPVALADPDDGTGRLFVVEKTGRIRVLRNGALEKAPLLDVSDRVSGGSEQGLLGLALHPKFKDNGRLFVDYTDQRGDTHVVELKAAPPKSDAVDPKTARELLFVKQPYANHNGGDLVFGPDGKLYVGLGDGGAGGDPHGNGQNGEVLLGKMVRLDVDAEKPRPEIVMKGLRNPWRYAFDRRTKDLYLADVGQNQFEEVDVAPAGRLDGLNFGWNVYEGLHCFKEKTCDPAGMTMPVHEYSHAGGNCSITGGFVYRGAAIPALDGVYFFADFCSGLLRGLRWADGKAPDVWDFRPALDPGKELANVTSFGEDAKGELYLMTLTGGLYKLVPRAAGGEKPAPIKQ